MRNRRSPYGFLSQISPKSSALNEAWRRNIQAASYAATRQEVCLEKSLSIAKQLGEKALKREAEIKEFDRRQALLDDRRRAIKKC